MKQTLKYILSLVTDNLKIAENKHGMLLALSSGLVVITVGFFSYSNTIIIILNWLVIFFASLSIFCCFMGLFSRQIRLNFKHNMLNNISLLYYKDLALLSPTELLNCIIIQYGFPRDYVCDGFENDLAKQIIANSKVAYKKYLFFNYSVIFLGVALFLDIILMAIVGMVA